MGSKTLHFACLAAAISLFGCRSVVEAKYPSGKPKVVRTYGLWGGQTPENMQREQTFYFNGNPEKDARYRKGALHGLYLDYWHNGQKKSQGKYVKGKQEGDWEFYFNKFSPSSKGLYRNDLKEGPWNEYWEDGNLKAEGAYRAGKKVGTWKGWTAKGEPLLETACFEANDQGIYRTFHAKNSPKETYACRRGVPVGPFVRLTPEGDTAERGAFDSLGRKQGTWETFHAQGRRASLRAFQGGLEQDSVRVWDEADRIRERGFFAAGTGEMLTYDSLGRLMERRQFRGGRPEGESWTYFPTGTKRSQVLYRDGQPVEIRKWHDNRSLAATGVFAAGGKRVGEWKQFDEKGVTREISRYTDGVLHGDRLFYDNQGKLIRTQTYEHGFPSKGTLPAGLAGRGAGAHDPSLPKRSKKAEAGRLGPNQGGSQPLPGADHGALGDSLKETQVKHP